MPLPKPTISSISLDHPANPLIRNSRKIFLLLRSQLNRRNPLLLLRKPSPPPNSTAQLRPANATPRPPSSSVDLHQRFPDAGEPFSKLHHQSSLSLTQIPPPFNPQTLFPQTSDHLPPATPPPLAGESIISLRRTPSGELSAKIPFLILCVTRKSRLGFDFWPGPLTRSTQPSSPQPSILTDPTTRPNPNSDPRFSPISDPTSWPARPASGPLLPARLLRPVCLSPARPARCCLSSRPAPDSASLLFSQPARPSGPTALFSFYPRDPAPLLLLLRRRSPPATLSLLSLSN